MRLLQSTGEPIEPTSQGNPLIDACRVNSFPSGQPQGDRETV
jgi:hypothetical protein